MLRRVQGNAVMDRRTAAPALRTPALLPLSRPFAPARRDPRHLPPSGRARLARGSWHWLQMLRDAVPGRGSTRTRNRTEAM